MGFFGLVFVAAIGCGAVGAKTALGKIGIGFGTLSLLAVEFVLLSSQ